MQRLSSSLSAALLLPRLARVALAAAAPRAAAAAAGVGGVGIGVVGAGGRASAPSAGYATTTRRRRKELRRSAALSRRQLLAFAALFDPLRTARAQVAQTLHYLGWAFSASERVLTAGADDAAAAASAAAAAAAAATDSAGAGATPDAAAAAAAATAAAAALGAPVDFVLREWYCAFEVVPGEAYVLESDARASSPPDRGFGPGVAPPRAPAPAAVAARDGADATFVRVPAASAFPSAPPEWRSAVRGLALTREVAARHAAIRAKGWKLVALPLPDWEAAAARRSQHYARRDLLLSLSVPLAPFEARAGAELAQAQARAGGGGAAAGGGKGRGGGEATGGGAGGSGGSGGGKEKRERAAAAAAAAVAVAGAQAGRAPVQGALLEAARRDSESGRSRKLRAAARRDVSRSEEVR